MLIPNLRIEDTVFEKGRGWYYENLIGSDTLVVTVGDSWTWGEDLDENYRTQQVYGQLIASELQADFVNISIPGASNVFVYDKLKLLLEHIQPYQTIYVFVTLTEVCRELVNDPIWSSNKTFTNIDELLADFEYNTLVAYKNLFEQYPNIRYLLGRNFTFTYNNNVSLINHLDKTWVEVLDRENAYPKNIRVLSSLAVNALKQVLSNSSEELVNLIESNSPALDWMENSNYIINGHPTEQAHQIWADYLLSKL